MVTPILDRQQQKCQIANWPSSMMLDGHLSVSRSFLTSQSSASPHEHGTVDKLPCSVDPARQARAAGTAGVDGGTLDPGTDQRPGRRAGGDMVASMFQLFATWVLLPQRSRRTRVASSSLRRTAACADRAGRTSSVGAFRPQPVQTALGVAATSS